MLTCAGLTFAAYCGERVLSETTNKWTELLEWYGEPSPEPTADLASVLESGLKMQKCILLGDQVLLPSALSLPKTCLHPQKSAPTSSCGRFPTFRVLYSHMSNFAMSW